MALKTFVRGSAVYKCRVCGRQARATSRDHIGCDNICAECFELAGIENTFSDCGAESEEALSYKGEALSHLKSLKSKGVNVDVVWSDLMSLLGEAAGSL